MSESIAGMVFALPLCNLRAQMYDGAVNMSGHYTGCQARLRQCQPLALYFHCASHIANLVMLNAIISCQLVRNALQWTNELGVLMNRPGKYTAVFQTICLSIKSSHILLLSNRFAQLGGCADYQSFNQYSITTLLFYSA